VSACSRMYLTHLASLVLRTESPACEEPKEHGQLNAHPHLHLHPHPHSHPQEGQDHIEAVSLPMSLRIMLP
jgi:hypothetical protein